MHIELTSILDQFDTVQDRVHRLGDNLTETRWAERADPTRWSVAECVAHLNLAGRAYLPLLREALEEAISRDEPPPARYRRDPLGWMLSLAMGPVRRIGRFRLGAHHTGIRARTWLAQGAADYGVRSASTRKSGACAKGRRAPDQSRLGDFSVRSAPAIQPVLHFRDPT